jgi:hypothetical protein
MSVFVDEPPPRLKQRGDQANLIERIAGQALRDVPRPKPLSALALARIADGIEQRAPAAGRPRRAFWIVVTAAFLIGVGTTASAQHLGVIRRWLTDMVGAGPAAPRETHPRAGNKPGLRGAERTAFAPEARQPSESPAGPSELPAPSRVEPAKVAEPRADEPREPAARRESDPGASTPGRPLLARPSREPANRTSHAPAAHTRLAYLAAPEAAVAPPLLATEAPRATREVVAPMVATSPPEPRLEEMRPPLGGVPKTAAREAPVSPATRFLTEAVRALRVERSPTTAIELLDRHAQELEGNALAREALLVRTEAMLALGRKSEVLRLLDRTGLTAGAASRALLLMRGELRASADRCAEAIGDFSLVLADARRPPRQALHGRAMCYEKLGDTERARADRDRYQRELQGERAIDGPDR